MTFTGISSSQRPWYTLLATHYFVLSAYAELYSHFSLISMRLRAAEHFVPGEGLRDTVAISASGQGLLCAGLFPPSTWNPSQWNCFPQLQHPEIAAPVSFKNSLFWVSFPAKNVSLSPAGTGDRTEARSEHRLFQRGGGAAVATCEPCP